MGRETPKSSQAPGLAQRERFVGSRVSFTFLDSDLWKLRKARTSEATSPIGVKEETVEVPP